MTSWLDKFTPVPDDFADLSMLQLQILKETWYREAVDRRFTTEVYKVGKVLGKELLSDYPSKYRWREGDLEIYVDTYGNYLTVRYRDRLVLSTHSTEALCVPGRWMDTIGEAAVHATRYIAEQERRKKEQERQDFLRKIDPRTL